MKPEKHELEPFVCNKKAAADKFGVTERTIYRWMLSYGICNKKPNYGPKLTSEQAIQIRSRYQAGDSIKEIASKHQVTLTAVYRVVNNVTYREQSKDAACVSVIYQA